MWTSWTFVGKLWVVVLRLMMRMLWVWVVVVLHRWSLRMVVFVVVNVVGVVLYAANPVALQYVEFLLAKVVVLVLVLMMAVSVVLVVVLVMVIAVVPVVILVVLVVVEVVVFLAVVLRCVLSRSSLLVVFASAVVIVVVASLCPCPGVVVRVVSGY